MNCMVVLLQLCYVCMYGVVCVYTYILTHSLTSKGENLIITRVRVSSSVRRKSISHGQSAATETNISLTLGYTQQLTKEEKIQTIAAVSNPHVLLDTVRFLQDLINAERLFSFSSILLNAHRYALEIA